MKLKVYKSLLDVKMIMGLPYKVFISLVFINRNHIFNIQALGNFYTGRGNIYSMCSYVGKGSNDIGTDNGALQN